jgi:hypothetical protein
LWAWAEYANSQIGREMDIGADKAMNYRKRAEHLRVIADGMTNRESREATLKVVGDYEHLAATIETMVGILPSERKA